MTRTGSWIIIHKQGQDAQYPMRKVDLSNFRITYAKSDQSILKTF